VAASTVRVRREADGGVEWRRRQYVCNVKRTAKPTAVWSGVDSTCVYTTVDLVVIGVKTMTVVIVISMMTPTVMLAMIQITAVILVIPSLSVDNRLVAAHCHCLNL